MSSEVSTVTRVQERLGENRYLRWLGSPGVGLVWAALFLFVPLTVIVLFSFTPDGDLANFVSQFTLENYARFVEASVYRNVIVRSVLIGVATTLVVLPFGYALGYFLGRTNSKWTPVLLGLVVIQFWVPLIIRTYAWIDILSRNGLLNLVLVGTGVLSEPVNVLYTTPGMLIGLVVSIMPFMVLPVYSAVSTINDDVIRAAKTLGATDLRAFWEVTLPLSWPGVVSGILFTFILASGSFVAPVLLGGPSDQMIAPLIAKTFLQDFNWQFASALSIIYFAFMAVVLYLFNRRADLEEALEGTQL
ncbi:ABC transporter permease [Halobacteriaceae archaeon GCM10025711]